MKKFWNNNKGASLILVIGCVALLSVVGSMLLMVTANNREMKALEKEIQNTFYQAESGSDELVSLLEAKAEVALGNAFADMLVHYNALSTEEQRAAYIGEYFGEALKTALSTDLNAMMAAGMNGASDVNISVSEVTVDAAADPNSETSMITMSGVTIEYIDGDGNAASITTDIKIQSGIPDLQNSLATFGGAGDYTDFALINGGNVVLESAMASSTSAKINGNMYTAGNVDISVAATLDILNAQKALVKNDIIIKNGKLTVANSAGIGDTGYGLWADGIEMLENSTLQGTSNLYIADDLTFSGSNSKVTLSGTEYVGFSGNEFTDENKKADNESSIVINDAQNINLDLSGMTKMILSGTAYVYEEKKSPTGDVVLSRVNPVMQGQSLGYKRMQAMYLAPAEVLGHSNPILTTLAEDDKTYSLSYQYGPNPSDTLELSDYLNATIPYLRRDAILDGGASAYTYYYMNFKDEKAAAAYVEAYLAITELKDTVEERVADLGTSEIKLAGTNNAQGVVMEYIGGTLTYYYPEDLDESDRNTQAFTAGKRQETLFTQFRLTGTPDVNWKSVDTLGTAVLNDGYADKIDLATSTPTSTNYHPYNGYTEISDTMNGLVVVNGDLDLSGTVNGIVLVDGNVTLSSTTGSVNGLLVATGTVTFQNAYTLNANPTLVETYLQDETIANFFRTTAGGAGNNSSFHSGDAVQVKFENWQRN